MVEKADERLLPANKIRTIMKSCGDPNALLSKESVLVVTKAAELFITYLTQQTYRRNGNRKDLNYNDLSKFVQSEDKLEFLHQIIPKKITVKQFREILANESGSSSAESSEDEDNEDGGSEEEDDEEEEEEEGEEEEEEEGEDEEGESNDGSNAGGENDDKQRNEK